MQQADQVLVILKRQWLIKAELDIERVDLFGLRTDPSQDYCRITRDQVQQV